MGQRRNYMEIKQFNENKNEFKDSEGLNKSIKNKAEVYVSTWKDIYIISRLKRKRPAEQMQLCIEEAH